MKRHLPPALTLLRLLLGPVALVLATSGGPRGWFVPVLLAATLSDYYDGVLARRFGVATPALRRFDSITDVVFYGFVLAAAWRLCQPQIQARLTAVMFLVVSELTGIVLSLVKFRTFPATHSLLAKCYGLCLLAACVALLAFNAPGWVLVALACVGTVANIEIITILWFSPTPPVDVASVFTIMERNGARETRE